MFLVFVYIDIHHLLRPFPAFQLPFAAVFRGHLLPSLFISCLHMSSAAISCLHLLSAACNSYQLPSVPLLKIYMNSREISFLFIKLRCPTCPDQFWSHDPGHLPAPFQRQPRIGAVPGTYSDLAGSPGWSPPPASIKCQGLLRSAPLLHSPPSGCSINGVRMEGYSPTAAVFTFE